MSRSFKKHCGGAICCGSDREWRRQWHSAMRAKVRDILRTQIKDTELDFIYPIPKEVANLWHAPSDGSSFKFNDFEEYYFFITDQNNSEPARKEVWKMWKKDMIGK